jgi:hypothetical protein
MTLFGGLYKLIWVWVLWVLSGPIFITGWVGFRFNDDCIKVEKSDERINQSKRLLTNMFTIRFTSLTAYLHCFQICTELLGRGIDFKGVNMVINYDFPSTRFTIQIIDILVQIVEPDFQLCFETLICIWPKVFILLNWANYKSWCLKLDEQVVLGDYKCLCLGIWLGTWCRGRWVQIFKKIVKQCMDWISLISTVTIQKPDCSGTCI